MLKISCNVGKGMSVASIWSEGKDEAEVWANFNADLEAEQEAGWMQLDQPVVEFGRDR